MLSKIEARLTLRPLQEKHAQLIMREPATLAALPLGSGKTTVTVEATRRLGYQRSLVIAPRNTANGWERTIRRQYQDYTNPDMFKRIDSSVSGKKNMEDFWAGLPGWYFVTWQYMALRPVAFWDKAKVDIVIADEVQRMQNRKSKTWRNMKNLGKTAKRVALSGTPQGNKMQGFWTTLRWLFPENAANSNSPLYRTPLSFWNWAHDWLVIEEDEWLGFTEVKGERFENGTMLSYYESYIRDADLSEVPAVNDIDIYVEMSPLQKRMYKQMIKDEIMWLDTPDPETGKKPSVAEIRAVTRMRLRQITLGVPAFNEDGKVSYAFDTLSSKLDAAIEEIGDLPDNEPVLAFTHSREYALVAAQRLTAAGYPAFAWVGGTTDKKRREAVDKWGKAGGPQIIVAVVEAIAEGTDGLQDICSEEIWFSESENRYMNEQARGRLPRSGQTKVVNRRRIIVPDTYDEEIIDKHLAARLDSNLSLRERVT